MHGPSNSLNILPVISVHLRVIPGVSAEESRVGGVQIGLEVKTVCHTHILRFNILDYMEW